MNADDFEQRLKQQPLRKIPTEWRAEILHTAMASAKPMKTAPSRLMSATWTERLASFFWPHPKAWAGLVAIWIVLLALNFSLRDGQPRIAAIASKPSRELILVLEQQNRLRAELIGPTASVESDRPKSNQPRSERRLRQALA